MIDTPQGCPYKKQKLYTHSLDRTMTTQIEQTIFTARSLRFAPRCGVAFGRWWQGALSAELVRV